MDFLKDIVKEIGDDYTKLAADIDDTEEFVDTGSYIFNGLVSAVFLVVYLGIRLLPLLASLLLEKLSSVFAVVKNFLDSNPDGYCLYFDTEPLLTKSLLADRGVDLSRVVVVNVVTIEEFRSKALKAVDIYLKKSEEDRKPCMFVLDSLGMLSTEKEITDALNDKQVRDMTKSQLVKGAFRMLTLKLGQANIPMIVTNHTYDVIGSYVPTKEMGGGSENTKYAASTIIYLSKKKRERWNRSRRKSYQAKTAKSRLSKENKEVTVRLYYDERGLDKYYGLLELGELGGLWKNVAGRYEINGKKIYAKQILASPEEYFTDDVMEKLDAIARETFCIWMSLSNNVKPLTL